MEDMALNRPGSAALTGTGLVADDLYLMAHHEATGRPYLHPRALGLGLAGALLAELVLSGNARIGRGAVVITRQSPPGDGLARIIQGELLKQGRWHSTQDWLALLARTSTDAVANRLARSGYLRQAEPQRWRRAPAWRPADPDCAFAALIRVKAALEPSRPHDDRSVVLAGLATACGLGSRLLPYGPPNARRCLEDKIMQLDGSLRDLVAHTQAAVDAAALSHRR
jgi:hypothetical protein